MLARIGESGHRGLMGGGASATVAESFLRVHRSQTYTYKFEMKIVLVL